MYCKMTSNVPQTCVVVLRNMVSIEEVDEDLQEEVGQECGKFGKVVNVVIHQDTTASEEESVKIFVVFSAASGKEERAFQSILLCTFSNVLFVSFCVLPFIPFSFLGATCGSLWLKLPLGASCGSLWLKLPLGASCGSLWLKVPLGATCGVASG